MRYHPLWTALLALASAAACAQDDTVQKRIVEDSDLGSYRWIMDTPSGVRFQLVQRIPDQTRSFYNGRGFPLEAADEYASACVMQTIVNNNSTDKVVTFKLADWRVVHDGKSRPLKLTSAWQQRWEQLDVPQPARIAFQWSQFPNVQKHEPGDWFQGMIAAELPGGTTFDLGMTWAENGVTRTATFRNIQCAKDRNLGGES